MTVSVDQSSVFQILSVLSSDCDAKYFPTGSKMTPLTSPVWPRNTRIWSGNLSAFQITTLLSTDAVAKRASPETASIRKRCEISGAKFHIHCVPTQAIFHIFTQQVPFDLWYNQEQVEKSLPLKYWRITRWVLRISSYLDPMPSQGYPRRGLEVFCLSSTSRSFWTHV